MHFAGTLPSPNGRERIASTRCYALASGEYNSRAYAAIPDRPMTHRGSILPAKPPFETVSDNKLDYLERKAEAARIRKLKNDISKVEEKIKKYEDRLNELDEMLEDPSISTNSAKLNEISKEQNDISKKLDDLMLQWEELSDQL